MTTPEFREWPKTPRLFRDVVITEKIDGTNACVVVDETGDVFAQSRSRMLTLDADNFGFARWVYNYAATLADILGPGYHYGEWWGSGIQRGYGLTGGDKRFSLFNAARWSNLKIAAVPELGVVPVLRRHTFDTDIVKATLADLVANGSQAAPGFMQPEGVIVYHSASRQTFKSLIESDGQPKSVAS